METLLGVSIDSELNFKNHISNICSKASRKLSGLGRIAGYILLQNVGCCSGYLLNLNLIIAH